MSGGRATIHVRKGDLNRQAGDIASISPEGHKLTDKYFIECKHYRDLKIAKFLLLDEGPLAVFWKVANREARKHQREPMLIARQNNFPTIAIMWTCPTRLPEHVVIARNGALVVIFDEVFQCPEKDLS
jgi:hypothetical protein